MAGIEQRAWAEVDRRVTIPTATTVRMADVEPKPIQWLWRPRIARGKLTLIAGDPGLGKSMLTANLAAHVTTGRTWPDGAGAADGSVILVSGEDDPGDTIRPRLDMAGANAHRVHYLQSVHDGNGERGFNLGDVIPLTGLLADIKDCALIIIDPVSAYLAGIDSHKNADIRALLTPLAQMAAAHNVAIVAVSHLNKAQAGNALSRVTGSLAFVAAARAAYVVARCPDDPTRRLLLPIKNNLGNDQTGMAYRIAEDQGIPYVTWEREPVTISADEALASVADDDQRSSREEAEEFLRRLLADLPVEVDEVKRETKAAGHSWATVRRAKDAIGAKSKKAGFGRAGAWCWYMPAKVLARTDTHLSILGINEHVSGVQASKGAQGAHVIGLGALGESAHLSAADAYRRAKDGDE